MARSPAAARPAPARARACCIATRKGLWTLTSDRRATAWKLAGPQFLGHIVHHAVVDPRDRRTLLAAARTGHLGPTVFRSTRQRPHVEGSDAPAGVRARQRPRRRSHVLADARPRRRAGRLVRRHVAAGPVPLGRRRRDVGRRRRLQRASAAQGMVRRRPGRHARRREAALDPRRSARSAAPVHRHVERRRVRVASTAAATGIRSTRACAPTSCPIRHPSSATIRIACASRAAIRIGCTSRTTAASIASTGPATRWQDIGASMPKSVGDDRLSDGRASARSGHAWVFPMDGTTCGRAPRRAAGPRSTARATAARRGSARTRACRSRRRGGRSSARR